MKRPTPQAASTRRRKTFVARIVEEYSLRLYVAGSSSRSRLAILHARALCANELKGHCTLEVIDIYQDPARARDEQILATPTLVKVRPLPVRRLIGAPARSGRLLAALGLDVPGPIAG